MKLFLHLLTVILNGNRELHKLLHGIGKEVLIT